jgi:hypothetical protein
MIQVWDNFQIYNRKQREKNEKQDWFLWFQSWKIKGLSVSIWYEWENRLWEHLHLSSWLGFHIIFCCDLFVLLDQFCNPLDTPNRKIGNSKGDLTENSMTNNPSWIMNQIINISMKNLQEKSANLSPEFHIKTDLKWRDFHMIHFDNLLRNSSDPLR